VVDKRWKGYEAYPIRAAVELARLQRQVTQSLSLIDQPVLVIQGRRDRLVDPGVPAFIDATVASQVREIRWLENSQHCLVLDHEWSHAAEWTAATLKQAFGRSEND
jgi:carboxylesterase